MNREKAADLKKQLTAIQDQLATVDAAHDKLGAQLKTVKAELAKLK